MRKIWSLTCVLAFVWVVGLAEGGGESTMSACTATANCESGTVYCEGNNTCSAYDRLCSSEQGHVTCDGVTTWCPTSCPTTCGPQCQSCETCNQTWDCFACCRCGRRQHLLLRSHRVLIQRAPVLSI